MVPQHRPFSPAVGLAILLAACGGSCPEPDEPSASREPTAAMAAPPPVETTDEEQAEAEEDEEDDAPTGPPPEPGPDFPENASVAQAIAAVPQGSERLNIDDETLAKPLQDPDLYEPCNAGSQHFKMKIAVWNGKAVGVDVVTKNEKLKECLSARIREIEWDDKVPSLNTIEYGF